MKCLLIMYRSSLAFLNVNNILALNSQCVDMVIFFHFHAIVREIYHASLCQLDTHTQAYTHIQCIHCSLFSTLYGSFKWLHWTERKDYRVRVQMYCGYCTVCIFAFCVCVCVCACIVSVLYTYCSLSAQWKLLQACRIQWTWC